MLNQKIITFLKLCDVMNYRITAEQLHITQPAVTQHIQFLEQEYNCKLFIYNGKTLTKTHNAIILEEFARSALYNEDILRKTLTNKPCVTMRIGATKSIGDYILPPKLAVLLKSNAVTLEVTIDNTHNLLQKLNDTQLDFALIEGAFDKEKYDWKVLQSEEFVGICAKDHPLANRHIPLTQLLNETLIVREEGSGTREVLEQLLAEQNYTVQSFAKVHTINNFNAILQLVQNNCGISFVYKAVANSAQNVACFTFHAQPVMRDLHYVYLKHTQASTLVKILEQI